MIKTIQSLYDYPKCIAEIEKVGKAMFGKHFKIWEEDILLITQLLSYILKDAETAYENDISFQKGILLTGPVGCGKTSLMKLLSGYAVRQVRYNVVPCRNISFDFIKHGYPIIWKYSRDSFEQYNRDEKGRFIPITYCFDDLGTENNLKYFGNECNVMAEILQSRYEFYAKTDGRMITHLTTNLNSDEIERLYGARVRSRMREMFNLISFSSSSKDKRN